LESLLLTLRVESSQEVRRRQLVLVGVPLQSSYGQSPRLREESSATVAVLDVAVTYLELRELSPAASFEQGISDLKVGAGVLPDFRFSLGLLLHAHRRRNMIYCALISRA